MQSNHSPSSGKKRSFSITLLAIFFLAASILGWVRVAQTISQWNYLRSLPLSIPVWFLLVTGLIDGVIGLLAIAILWLRIPRSRYWVMAAASLYAVLYWGGKVLFSAARSTGKNIPFEVLVTFLLLIYTWMALWWTKTGSHIK
jgi:hypothetical protein